MRPSNLERFGSDHLASQDLAMNSSNARRLRTEDSWIEISSRPSSSSLSSTTGDLVQNQATERASRQLRIQSEPQIDIPRPTSVAGSSQDEYEESESESDRVLSSSNEDLGRGEEDDDRTAIGIGPLEKIFTPQPNAFSHPPSQRSAPSSYFPQVSSASASATRSERAHRSRPSLQRDRISTGSYQPDHDAALRASLTTLLSCAAAVRPKPAEKVIERSSATRSNTRPTSLRLLPESELDPRLHKLAKRKSRESSKERHSKKVRAVKAAIATEDVISTSLTSWMISAGVVLVISALSFSAGYAWGKEAGRIEAKMGLNSGSCGSEMRGGSLRRLRWTTASSVRT